MAADAATSCDRSLEDRTLPFSCRSVHYSGELVHKWPERHHLARQKIPLEQIARISQVRFRAERSPRKVRDGDEHRRSKDAQKIRAKQLASDFTLADERRLLALSRLHSALERRVHCHERPIRPTQHRLVQRSQRMLSRSRPSSNHSGNRFHKKLRWYKRFII